MIQKSGTLALYAGTEWAFVISTKPGGWLQITFLYIYKK